MGEVVVVAPALRGRTRAIVAATVLLAALVVALVVWWPAGSRSSHATDRAEIPRHLIVEAEQVRAAWAQLPKVPEADATATCPVGPPC